MQGLEENLEGVTVQPFVKTSDQRTRVIFSYTKGLFKRLRLCLMNLFDQIMDLQDA